MLKVLLADDEEIIREGLYHGFDWGKMGLEVVGLAEDGEEALAIMREKVPEIIVTDIKMPFVDGLELVERGKLINPNSYFILISGHEEFSYVQKAIKLGAYDYILKPIELDYLKQIILKVIADYKAKKRKEEVILDLQAKVDDHLPVLREDFLRKLIAGNLKQLEVERKLEENEFGSDLRQIVAAIVQLDDYYVVAQMIGDERRKLVEKNLAGLVKTFNSEEIIAFANKPFEYVLIFFGRIRTNLAQTVQTTLTRIRLGAAEIKPFTLSIAIGGHQEWPYGLSRSFREAEEALTYKFIIGKNRNIYYQTDKPGKIIKEERLITDFGSEEILSAIKANDRGCIRETLTQIVAYLTKEGESSRIKMELVVGNIFLQAVKFLYQNGSLGEEVFNDPLDVYHKIISAQTANDMASELLAVLLKIMDYLEDKGSNRLNRNIEKAKAYIRENHGCNDLTLEKVANHVHMGSTYFSFLFKQEEGENFIEYVTRIRMEKAKELLTYSSFRSYEIAYLVGFNNPTYFSTSFKRYYGFSPSEYKKRLFAKKVKN